MVFSLNSPVRGLRETIEMFETRLSPKRPNPRLFGFCFVVTGPFPSFSSAFNPNPLPLSQTDSEEDERLHVTRNEFAFDSKAFIMSTSRANRKSEMMDKEETASDVLVGRVRMGCAIVGLADENDQLQERVVLDPLLALAVRTIGSSSFILRLLQRGATYKTEAGGPEPA